MPVRIRPTTRLALTVAGLVFVLDQASKALIVWVVMQPPRVIPVTPFFNLVMAWNRGISFSLFSTDAAYAAWLFSAVALAIVAGLLVWLRRVDQRLLAVAIGLIIGGAVGNVVDRLLYGAVADFLDFYVGDLHWPAFNLADSAISIAVALLVADALFARRQTNT